MNNFRIRKLNKQVWKMESKEDKKKTRGRNFEFAEKDLLIDCAGKNRTIIEEKLTNSVTVSRKRAVWEGSLGGHWCPN